MIPLPLSPGRQTKKATRGPNRPRMASMPLLSMVASIQIAERKCKIVTQTSMAAWQLFRIADFSQAN
jgi:hypothetical protein